ncbi:MAG: cyclic nucleotide-binding domain-containing protein [Tatlockia sp.]|nr:cyclic nucleotide-binding domain-containing protein [Tatlockia sp.]
MTKTIKFDLEKIPILSGLTAKEIQYIAPCLEEKKFEKDEVILSQGSLGGELYLLIDGSVSVDIVLPGNCKKNLMSLGKGQLFGEITFFSDVLVTASVVAEKSCVCMVFNHNALESLHFIKPETAYKIEKEITQQTANKLILNLKSILELLNKIPDKARAQFGHALYLENPSAKNYPLELSDLNVAHLDQFNIFQRLTKEEIKRLLPLMSVKLYEKGYRFFTNQDESDKLTFVYSGAVMFFIKEDNELKKSLSVLKAGELFLRDFLYKEFQQLADYVTCEKCILLELDIEAYKKLLHSDPTLFYAINKSINRTVASFVYVMNRELVRLNSEYNNILL